MEEISTTEDRVEAPKKLDDTSDLLQEEWTNDGKENIEKTVVKEHKTPKSNLHYSSLSLADGENEKDEVISNHAGISISFPAEQGKEENSISEDKTEAPKKLENAYDLVTEEQNNDAKENTENVVIKDPEKQDNLCDSSPILAVGESAENVVSGLFYEVSTHDFTKSSNKMKSIDESDPDGKMDNGKSNHPDLEQNQKIHAMFVEKMTGNVENLNEDFNVSSVTKGSPEEILQNEGGEDGKVILQDPEKVENSSYAITEKSLSISESVGNTKSMLQHEETVTKLQYKQTGKPFESSTPENQKHKEDLEIESEIRQEENGEENHDKMAVRVQNVNNYSDEKPKVSDSQKVWQSDLILKSKNETVQIAENFLEERSTEVSINEKKTKEETDTQMEEEKTEEEKDEKEEEDEHKIKESGQDAAIIVEARDTNSKQAHKKSHNILSGVGSKVKQSFAKVKKAITGKSSHPKAASPK